jgi:hypothetical protein
MRSAVWLLIALGTPILCAWTPAFEVASIKPGQKAAASTPRTSLSNT